MKATKHTVVVTVEVLSLDVVPSLLCEAASQIRKEYVGGELTGSDGDSVKWEVTKSEPVEF